MTLLSKLRSWLFGPPPQSPDVTYDQLPWLEPHENPFGIRVLDCRPFAESVISASESPTGSTFFDARESRTGESFRGKLPEESLRVACDLRYALKQPLREGPVFLASVMEEKWNIYRFGETLYFVRSWSGQLQYVATISTSESDLVVTEVIAWTGNVLGEDALAARQVDFLIKSHLFNQSVPHPIVDLGGGKKGIALLSFQQYGRRGKFAAVEGMTQAREVP